MDRDWIKHWIDQLIDQSTIDNNTFAEWMWCPERYLDEDLDYMAGLWVKRRLRNYHGGLIPDSMLGGY